MYKKIIFLIILMLITTISNFCKNSSENIASDENRINMVVAFNNMEKNNELEVVFSELSKIEKFSYIDFEFLPQTSNFNSNIPVKIAMGDQIDLIVIETEIIKDTWAKAGILAPLDKYIDELDIDIIKTYGPNHIVSKYNGSYYTIPHEVTQNVLYYNKTIFDNAGIEYPNSTEPMTWDEYSELSKSLTSGQGEEKIYGSLHMPWPLYWNAQVIQELGYNAFYNEQGLSNFDKMIFYKSLERTYKMAFIDESIPSYSQSQESNINSAEFMNGMYGMVIGGNEFLDFAILQAKYEKEDIYPRDWNIGIAPLPVKDSKGILTSWGHINSIGIPITSKNPKLALEVIIELTKLINKFTITTPEAYQLSDSPELYREVGDVLQVENMPMVLIESILGNTKNLILNEKIIGINNEDYKKVVNYELKQFFVNNQNLEVTISNIINDSNKIIEGK